MAEASVAVSGVAGGSIGRGLLVYLGVAAEDGPADADWLAGKVRDLRIFEDSAGKMNLSLAEAAAATGTAHSVLAVSQFTLMGDARKGRRPSWAAAAEPGKARALYLRFVAGLRAGGVICETGEFGADMAVRSVNSGPVTVLLDSRVAVAPVGFAQ